MNLAHESERAAWRDYLGAVFTGRKLIAGFGVLAAYPDLIRRCTELKTRKPLLVVHSRGAGPVPADEEAFVVYFEATEHESVTEDVRDRNRIAHNLPEHVVRAVEEYDPDCEALWHLDPFVENTAILGRQVYGGRPASWIALEDKLVAEQIWQALDIPRAPSLVVDVDPGALDRASKRLDQGHGAVWTGDARDGINGSGDFVRWVVTDDDRSAAYSFFATRCDQVRVMPFLEGVPCSIHGVVLPDAVAAFRPVELAMLRIPSRRRFVYGGLGTTWDPPACDRDQMRDLARRTGEHLRSRAGYRGFFGIDGVLTEQGFRPTEVNTRMSGGATSIGRATDIDTLSLLQDNLVAGRDPRVTVDELEAWMLPALDANRMGKPIAISHTTVVDDAVDVLVTWDGKTLARATQGRTHDLFTLMVGPTGSGTFAKLDAAGLGPGDRLAPLNVALMQFLDAEFGTEFGPVKAAPDVR